MQEISSSVEWAQNLKKKLKDDLLVKKQFEKEVVYNFDCLFSRLFGDESQLRGRERIEEIRHLLCEYDRCMKVWE